MIIGALDPGKTGAMVVLFEDGSVSVSRVPLVKPKGKKTSPDYRSWASSWSSDIGWNLPDVWVVENVHARPGQGVTSMFNFGKSYGFAMGVILASSKAPVHYVTPAVWKAKLGLIGFDKSRSVDLAVELIPSIVSEFNKPWTPKEVRHGIAEAALLAYYGLMTIAQGPSAD